MKQAKKMSLENHKKVGLHLRKLRVICLFRNRSEEMLSKIKCELDNWVAREYKIDVDISFLEFTHIYYGQDGIENIKPKKFLDVGEARPIFEEIENIKEILKESYGDITEIKKIIQMLESTQVDVTKWELETHYMTYDQKMEKKMSESQLLSYKNGTPFYRWLIKQHARDDVIGDVAKDLLTESNSSDRKIMSFEFSIGKIRDRSYLYNSEVLQCFEEAWKEFKNK